MIYGVVWNLGLAAIPAVLGYLLVWMLGASRKLPLLRFLAAPVALLWLVFLPNACYLLTEWRHLLFDPRWEELLDSGSRDPNAMLRTAFWSLLFLGYSASGMLLFVIAIRPIERWLREHRVRTLVLAPFFFGLVSLGVYLGLICRFNSWDLLHRPLTIWDAAVQAVTYAPVGIAIGIFAVLLWFSYDAINLWADGIAARLQHWRILPKPGGSGNRRRPQESAA